MSENRVSTCIYLAGRINDNDLLGAVHWRSNVTRDLVKMGFDVRDPLRGLIEKDSQGKLVRRQFPSEFIFERDLNDIAYCSVILVNLSSYHDLKGTFCEIGYAYALGKQIWGWDVNSDVPKDDLFTKNMVTQFIGLTSIYKKLKEFHQQNK